LGHNLSKSLNGMRLATIAPDNAEIKYEARKFMMDTFYREAVVPSALGLSNERKVLDRELDMYLNSGFSLTLHNEVSNELIGCHLCTSWKKNPHYKILDNVTMTSWHTTAAEIAMEENPTHPQVCVITFAKSMHL
jgi:hypothetical protein